MKNCIIALLFSSVALLSGCLTGRRLIALDTPQAAPASISKGAIRITSVTDNRMFLNESSDPSTPTINGDVTTMTPEQKSKMIGRQRNAFGKAKGDLALSGDDTVTKQAQALVETALKARGYQIAADASADPITAAVSIDEFWAWITAGTYASTYARVTCTITITKGGTPVKITVRGYGSNKGVFGNNAELQIAYDRACANFLENFKVKLDATAF